VFQHHAPLVALATTGEIAVRRKPEHSDDMLEHFASTPGVIEITNKRVRVLVDEAETDEEIDEQEARKAYDRAKELQAQARDKVSLAQAQDLLDRSAVRIKVAGLRRNRRKTR
jgi:F0F1-type ATP synthase epsilon subunit